MKSNYLDDFDGELEFGIDEIDTSSALTASQQDIDDQAFLFVSLIESESKLLISDSPDADEYNAPEQASPEEEAPEEVTDILTASSSSTGGEKLDASSGEFPKIPSGINELEPKTEEEQNIIVDKGHTNDNKPNVAPLTNEIPKFDQKSETIAIEEENQLINFDFENQFKDIGEQINEFNEEQEKLLGTYKEELMRIQSNNTGYDDELQNIKNQIDEANKKRISLQEVQNTLSPNNIPQDYFSNKNLIIKAKIDKMKIQQQKLKQRVVDLEKESLELHQVFMDVENRNRSLEEKIRERNVEIQKYINEKVQNDIIEPLRDNLKFLEMEQLILSNLQEELKLDKILTIDKDNINNLVVKNPGVLITQLIIMDDEYLKIRENLRK